MTSKRLRLAALPLLLAGVSPALAAHPGATYTCRFQGHGKVVIDTREPGSSITVGGNRYPAQGGSYFYQTEDGKVAFFEPGMKSWSYVDARVDPDLKGVERRRCVRRANRR